MKRSLLAPLKKLKFIFLLFGVIFFIAAIANTSIDLLLCAIFFVGAYSYLLLVDYAFLKPNREREENLRKKNESRLQRLEEERKQGLKKKNIDASKEFINQLVEIIE